MKKNNQIKARKTRQAGSEDMDFQDKKRVCVWLKRHGYNYAVNRYFLIPKDLENQNWALCETVHSIMLRKYKLVTRPDIWAWKGKEQNQGIAIEIDGKVHKKELDSRKVYAARGIKQVIINKEYLKKINKTWEVYLGEHL